MGDTPAIVDMLREHSSIDILVDDEFQEAAAIRRAEHDGHAFPDAEVQIIIAPSVDIREHSEATGRPTMWYWSGEAKKARMSAVVPSKSRIRRVSRRR